MLSREVITIWCDSCTKQVKYAVWEKCRALVMLKQLLCIASGQLPVTSSLWRSEKNLFASLFVSLEFSDQIHGGVLAHLFRQVIALGWVTQEPFGTCPRCVMKSQRCLYLSDYHLERHLAVNQTSAPLFAAAGHRERKGESNFWKTVIEGKVARKINVVLYSFVFLLSLSSSNSHLLPRKEGSTSGLISSFCS